ncbi:hypothetical protein MHH70_11415 [Metasolibacillus sp. FSL H7-0170]|uniref:hypothetical protein n=2 Tax=unclassified Metasolibacillus TaxID=2703679 RepID=UPI0031584C63
MVKKRIVIIAFLALVIIIVGGNFMMKKTIYSVTDILEGVDFDVEEQSLSVESIDIKTEDMFKVIEISEVQQKKLIDTFSKAKFQKTNYSSEWDYRINITLNKGYVLYLDSNKKIIVPENKRVAYVIKGDNDFFSVLNELVK